MASNNGTVGFTNGLDVDDWIKDDVEVATPDNDPNVIDPLRPRKNHGATSHSWSMGGSDDGDGVLASHDDFGPMLRGRSGRTHPEPRMPPKKSEQFVCPPIKAPQVAFDECQLVEETDMCYVESPEPEPPKVEICKARPRCTDNAAQRSQNMSMPSNLILSKPSPENAPIGVYPGPRPRVLRQRLATDMKNICSVYESLKGKRKEIIELGEAADLKEAVRCLETDVVQIENVRDALKNINEQICTELKIAGGFAKSKFGSSGMAARQILVAQRKELEKVREERLNDVRAAIDSLAASDKLTEEAYEAIKYMQKCPEDCAEDQRRTALSMTMDLMKIADDSFCRAIMSIDWILASFCSKEAVAGNVVKAILRFIDEVDEHNPRYLQMLKLTDTHEKVDLRYKVENDNAMLLKSLRQSRKCLVKARNEFMAKFQPIPPTKLYKSDYPRGSSRRASSVVARRTSTSTSQRRSSSARPSVTLAANREVRCIRRDDLNDILEPSRIRNIKRHGMI